MLHIHSHGDSLTFLICTFPLRDSSCSSAIHTSSNLSFCIALNTAGLPRVPHVPHVPLSI